MKLPLDLGRSLRAPDLTAVLPQAKTDRLVPRLPPELGLMLKAAD